MRLKWDGWGAGEGAKEKPKKVAIVEQKMNDNVIKLLNWVSKRVDASTVRGVKMPAVTNDSNASHGKAVGSGEDDAAAAA